MSRQELLTVSEFAHEVGLTTARVRQLIADNTIAGEKYGTNYMIKKSMIKKVLRRPERRGRPKKQKETNSNGI